MVKNSVTQILLVEDPHANNQRWLSAQSILPEPHTLVRRDNLTDVFSIINPASPDLILIDEDLSAMSADLALKTLLQLDQTPVIILSAQPEVERAVAFIRQGAFDYIDKKNQSRLQAAVNEALKISTENRARQYNRTETNLALRLLENLADPILILTQNGDLNYANPAALEYFQISKLSAKTYQKFSLSSFLAPEDLARAQTDLEKVISAGAPLTASYAVILPGGEKRWIEARGTRITYRHDILDLVCIRDYTDHRQSLQDLHQRDRLLEGVAHMTHLLLIEPDLEQCMQQVLAELGQAADVDRTYIFRNHREPGTNRLLISQWLEWAKCECNSQLDNPQLVNIPYDSLSVDLYSNLTHDSIFQSYTDQLDLFPRKILENQNILSLLLVPIFVDREFWGIIGFDNCTQARVWLDSEVTILKTAANTIGAAINRSQMTETLRESENRYRILFEDSPAIIWQEDFSAVKKHLETLKAQGVIDFMTYFKQHPEFVTECIRLTRIIDCNKAALRLHHVASKEQMPDNLEPLFPPESLYNFHYELQQIANGCTEFETEVVNQTVTGQTVILTMKWAALPGYEEDLSNVITSMIDITTSKQNELALIQTNQSIHRQVNQLKILHEIGSAITLHSTPTQVMQKILEQLINDIELDAAAFVSIGHQPPFSRLVTQIGLPSNLVAAHYHTWEEECVQTILAQSGPVFLSEKQSAELYNQYYWEIRDIYPSFGAVPVVVEDHIQAVLMVYSQNIDLFEKSWQDFLKSVALQAAISIENSRIVSSLQNTQQDLQDAYEGTLQGWAQALELRDKETKGHSDRVIRLSVQLAQALNYPAERMTDFRRGVMLHDIGKMAIPDSILFKPGSLNEDERLIMRQHPVYAHQLLSKIPYLKSATEIPLYHHERWDGSGYPKGLRGEQIPLAARIFSVVDVWDAVTSDRPYHPAFPEQAARQIILHGRGSQFDPIVVDAFLKILDQSLNLSENSEKMQF